MLPIPSAKVGLFLIKKAQSAPNMAAYSSNFSSARCKLNYSFNNFSMKAAFAEPPPKPAPEGMCLYR